MMSDERVVSKMNFSAEELFALGRASGDPASGKKLFDALDSLGKAEGLVEDAANGIEYAASNLPSPHGPNLGNLGGALMQLRGSLKQVRSRLQDAVYAARQDGLFAASD